VPSAVGVAAVVVAAAAPAPEVAVGAVAVATPCNGHTRYLGHRDTHTLLPSVGATLRSNSQPAHGTSNLMPCAAAAASPTPSLGLLACLLFNRGINSARSAPTTLSSGGPASLPCENAATSSSQGCRLASARSLMSLRTPPRPAEMLRGRRTHRVAPARRSAQPVHLQLCRGYTASCRCRALRRQGRARDHPHAGDPP
jgi:hypothetical protein